MEKKEFEQRVLEQQIFNEVKDGAVSLNYLRGKYSGLNIDHSRLYRRIVNYQVKTYGGSLGSGCESFFKTKEEYIKAQGNSRKRRYYKLNRSSNEKDR